MTGIQVLHVDDEADIREVVRISLELDPDVTVLSCASGSEALATTIGQRPDLVLLDVMMPDMDGPATLSGLRRSAQFADVPVVFMTARTQPREVEHFKSLGAVDVIAKPFDPIRLPELLRKHLAPKPSPAVNETSSALQPDGQAVVKQAPRSDGADRVERLAGAVARISTLSRSDGRCIVDACHELRGPLAVIKAYSDILSSELATEADDEQRTFFSIISERIADMDRMIDLLSTKGHTTADAGSADAGSGKGLAPA